MTWRGRFVLAAVLAVILGAVGLVASVLLVGLHLSRPVQRLVGPPPPDLPGTEVVSIPVPDAPDLRGWFVPGRTPGGGVVLLMHGVRGNRSAMVRRAVVLHRAGFGVLLFDLQGHGESEGRHITFGAVEGKGVTAAAAFARQRTPGERLGADGVSLGGAAAVLAPDLHLDALVLESVYPTIDAALINRLRENLPPGLAAFTPILTPVFKLLMPQVIGVAPSDLRPIDHIGTVGAPVLILGGSLDTRTPPAETRALFAAAHEPKQLDIVEGADHVDLEEFDPAGYWRIVMPFLQRTLQ